MKIKDYFLHYKLVIIIGLFLIALIPIFVFSEPINDEGDGYKMLANSQERIQPRLSNGELPSTAICFNNNSNKDYFVPNNSGQEALAFLNSNLIKNSSVYHVVQSTCCEDDICSEGETSATCPNDCGSVSCDYNPDGIYSGGVYAVSRNGVSVGAYPDCGISKTLLAETYPIYYDTQKFTPDNGTGDYVTKCVSLFKANSVCNGDLCLKGIAPKYTEGDNSSILSPQFCIGEYASSTKTCNYLGSDSVYNLSYNMAAAVSNFSESEYFNYSTIANPTAIVDKAQKTEATWGYCANCGDTVCNTAIGETCANCSADCGACATCGNGACEYSAYGETCANCSADCGACETIYIGAAYYASPSAYGEPPTCGLYNQMISTFNSDYRHLSQGGLYQCVSLFKATDIKDGDPCITGIKQINQLSPEYCVGHYNAATHKCIYERTATAMHGYIAGETLTVQFNNGGEGVWNNISQDYQTVGTFGRCSN